jgi:coenzyme F420-dependent glucose-6-phosphate dehydrogenase
VALIGYHASHEQFLPSDLLDYVRLAEALGFDAAMCSDHFFPWSEQQGNSGNAWSWLGAALQATGLSFGTVCAPGQRYHPAIIAQAAATLAEMFPERLWVALGSGQYLNEHITGEPWPRKADRNARLKECVDIMRALWDGETVTHRGHVVVEDAQLYSRPETPPAIVGAAITPKTAAWVADWADALITVAQPIDELRPTVDAFKNGGGSDKPMYLQVQLSFAPTDEEAREAALAEWGTNILGPTLLSDLRMPAHFEAAAEFVTEDDVTDSLLVSSDPERLTEWLLDYLDLGFERLYLHNVHRDQRRFLEVFGEYVLPEIHRSR